mmetsp:Transcript_39596/g.104690  ORF Transcript_39596/g.104690 Transcript_39596/m.104690 type:complete len:131 (+) Transcript_39596:730-1122(+)
MPSCMELGAYQVTPPPDASVTAPHRSTVVVVLVVVLTVVVVAVVLVVLVEVTVEVVAVVLEVSVVLVAVVETVSVVVVLVDVGPVNVKVDVLVPRALHSSPDMTPPTKRPWMWETTTALPSVKCWLHTRR